jgi:hypothetical protein
MQSGSTAPRPVIAEEQRPRKEKPAMAYSRRNIADEQQESCWKASQLTALCQSFHITLDPIDWQQFGLWAPVKVNAIEIASLQDLGQREGEDLLRQIQIKLLAHAALATLPASPGLHAVMWTPIEVVRPQAFLNLWIVTLDTDVRIPLTESISNGQRVYQHYRFDGEDEQQLAQLFGPLQEGEYHRDESVTFKERDRQYTGEILYIIPPGKIATGRRNTARGYHGTAVIASNNDSVARYLVDCHDGFPHIVYQWQVLQ